MHLILSSRSTAARPSATLAVNARAKQLTREGKHIINLSVGEPDFDTPDFIKAVAIKAIHDGFTKYTNSDGIPELKDAIIKKLHRDNGLSYSAQEIIVSNGVKHGLYNLCQAILNPGDEVIIPAPYWVSYPAMVELAGGKAVAIVAPQAQDFKITPEQLAQAITTRTKLFIINSPSNPSGKAYTADELLALAKVLLDYPQIVIATDDMYEYILWSQAFVNIVNVCPSLRDRTIVFNGVSKAYAMTGWRIGYAAGPAEIIAAMNTIQSQNSGNPNSIAQKASVTALATERPVLEYMFQAYKKRHDQLIADLAKIQGFVITPADGTFYLFPNVETVIQKLGLRDDIEFATFLLEKAEVATVPGSAFGLPGYIRISYAVSEETLREAAQRIAKAIH